MGLDMGLVKNGEEVCYWRKSNHIHAWITDVLNDGIDENELQQKLSETMNGLTDFFKNMENSSTQKCHR